MLLTPEQIVAAPVRATGPPRTRARKPQRGLSEVPAASKESNRKTRKTRKQIGVTP